ncbi:MAG: FAD-binding protein [Coriobacteriales bacterium]|jgi:succinate dehydrogenase/fumarate reductase flavoprotein subunit|nr:FAD-binding protein [Coriobacteriales bacterium]
MDNNKISRRSFIKGAAAVGAVGAAGAALGACTPTGSAADNIKWDLEGDVVVLGTGAGGLCSSIAAARKGAKVLLLEKSNEDDQGGNTRVSGNMWTTATDPAEGLKYYIAASERVTDNEYLKALVEAGPALNTEFLDKLPDFNRLELAQFSPEFEALPGKGVIQAWQNGATVNGQLWNALRAAADLEANIEGHFETPGKRLITNEAGEVIGVVAEQGGKEINVKARKGVVLACGGYEFNEYLLQNSYPGWPPYSRGTPYNTGDGILMAQKAGAGLWHMNASDSGVGAILAPGLNFGHGAYDSDKVPVNIGFSVGRASAMFKNLLQLDKYGKRFMPEDRDDSHGYGRREYLFFYDGVKCEWPNLPFWTVIDKAGATTAIGMGAVNGPDGSPLMTFTWFTARSGYTWSADNEAEVARGWIIKADTIEDLAAQMTAKQANERQNIGRAGVVVDPAVLRKTIEDYNGYCAAGNDPDFGRSPETMVALEPPFYAVQTYPNQYNTQGGPKRNAKAQTLDAFDKPIPRLYNAGECGAGYGWVYNGGWNNAEAMITGLWAGEGAAALESWDA